MQDCSHGTAVDGQAQQGADCSPCGQQGIQRDTVTLLGTDSDDTSSDSIAAQTMPVLSANSVQAARSQRDSTRLVPITVARPLELGTQEARKRRSDATTVESVVKFLYRSNNMMTELSELGLHLADGRGKAKDPGPSTVCGRLTTRCLRLVLLHAIT